MKNLTTIHYYVKNCKRLRWSSFAIFFAHGVFGSQLSIAIMGTVLEQTRLIGAIIFTISLLIALFDS